MYCSGALRELLGISDHKSPMAFVLTAKDGSLPPPEVEAVGEICEDGYIVCFDNIPQYLNIERGRSSHSNVVPGTAVPKHR